MSHLQEGRAQAWPNSRNMATVNQIEQNHNSLGRDVSGGSRTLLVCLGARRSRKEALQVSVSSGSHLSLLTPAPVPPGSMG